MAFSPRINAFLAAIRVMPNITRAAKAAGIRPCQHYRKLDTSADYRAAFDACRQIGRDALADVAVERAQIGWDEPIVYKGSFSYPEKWDEDLDRMVPDFSQKPLTIRKIDNNLLQFILKNCHPDYREQKQQVDGAAAAPPLIIQTYNDSPEQAPVPDLP